MTLQTSIFPSAELSPVGDGQDEMKPILAEYPGLCEASECLSENELVRSYNQSSVYVAPSVEDGWGHVTSEATFFGLPVIDSANVDNADDME